MVFFIGKGTERAEEIVRLVLSEGKLVLGCSCGCCICLFYCIYTALAGGKVGGSHRWRAVPGLLFLYTADDLYQMAEQYGEAGRSAYIHARFTFDLIWPLAYLFLLVVLLSVLYRVLPVKSPWRWVNLIPVLGWAMDMFENVGASLIMYRYPERTPVLVELTPIFTLLKWCLIYASFALLVPGVLIRVLYYIRKRKN